MSRDEKHWLERTHVCEHEACHAVVAQQMGLPVDWVTVDPGCDEGINFAAAVKIPDEKINRAEDIFAICVAMAAPVHFHTHARHAIERYAQLEFDLALQMAGMAGIEAGLVYDESAEKFHEHYAEIIELAQRLYEEGTVLFEEVGV
jgi:predicted transcriptional regulator